jgi:alpha-1,3-glucan synthase
LLKKEIVRTNPLVVGIDANGKPDRNIIYGDINKDGVLDRMSPQSFAVNVLTVEDGPSSPYLSWQLEVNDGTLRYEFKPIGSRMFQKIVFFSLICLPVMCGGMVALTFRRLAYQVSIYSNIS